MQLRRRAAGDSPVALGIETATTSGGIALASADGRLIAHHWALAPTGYSRRLMAAISRSLEEAGLAKDRIRAIGVTAGPGSFTGVRVGLATAKTLAHALGVPLYLFSTLEMAARRWPASAGEPVCVALDARRGEIYSGVYRFAASGESESLRPESAETLEALLADMERRQEARIWFSGDAAAKGRAEIAERLKGKAGFVPAPWDSPAADIVALRAAKMLAEGAPGIDPFAAAPAYLRASDAERALEDRGAAEPAAPLGDEDLFAQFTAAVLPAKAWTHEAHLRIAWLHLERMTPEASLGRLRDAIKKLNAFHGLVESETRGYHETLTRLWLALVHERREAGGRGADSLAFLARHPDLMSRELPLRYYAKERIFSPAARREYLPPELAAWPEADGASALAQVGKNP